MPRLGVAVFALLVSAACRHTNIAPASTGTLRVRSVAPPRSVVRTAAQELTAVGFLITAIDSSTRLRAEREHPAGEFDGNLVCRSATTPAGRASVAPTLILELAAVPREGGGSELLVASRVHATYLRLTADPARPSSDSDCRSTGVAERHLAEKLGTPQP
jgi:hypothetical protein